jgi:hypothetical protein
MGLGNLVSASVELLDGENMTGRQAAIIIALWMGATALFGIISYVIVFVILDF